MNPSEPYTVSSPPQSPDAQDRNLPVAPATVPQDVPASDAGYSADLIRGMERVGSGGFRVTYPPSGESVYGQAFPDTRLADVNVTNPGQYQDEQPTGDVMSRSKQAIDNYFGNLRAQDTGPTGSEMGPSPLRTPRQRIFDNLEQPHTLDKLSQDIASPITDLLQRITFDLPIGAIGLTGQKALEGMGGGTPEQLAAYRKSQSEGNTGNPVLDAIAEVARISEIGRQALKVAPENPEIAGSGFHLTDIAQLGLPGTGIFGLGALAAVSKGSKANLVLKDLDKVAKARGFNSFRDVAQLEQAFRDGMLPPELNWKLLTIPEEMRNSMWAADFGMRKAEEAAGREAAHTTSVEQLAEYKRQLEERRNAKVGEGGAPVTGLPEQMNAETIAQRIGQPVTKEQTATIGKLNDAVRTKSEQKLLSVVGEMTTKEALDFSQQYGDRFGGFITDSGKIAGPVSGTHARALHATFGGNDLLESNKLYADMESRGLIRVYAVKGEMYVDVPVGMKLSEGQISTLKSIELRQHTPLKWDVSSKETGSFTDSGQGVESLLGKFHGPMPDTAGSPTAEFVGRANPPARTANPQPIMDSVRDVEKAQLAAKSGDAKNAQRYIDRALKRYTDHGLTVDEAAGLIKDHLEYSRTLKEKLRDTIGIHGRDIPEATGKTGGERDYTKPATAREYNRMSDSDLVKYVAAGTKKTATIVDDAAAAEAKAAGLKVFRSEYAGESTDHVWHIAKNEQDIETLKMLVDEGAGTEADVGRAYGYSEQDIKDFYDRNGMGKVPPPTPLEELQRQAGRYRGDNIDNMGPGASVAVQKLLDDAANRLKQQLKDFPRGKDYVNARNTPRTGTVDSNFLKTVEPGTYTPEQVKAAKITAQTDLNTFKKLANDAVTPGVTSDPAALAQSFITAVESARGQRIMEGGKLRVRKPPKSHMVADRGLPINAASGPLAEQHALQAPDFIDHTVDFGKEIANAYGGLEAMGRDMQDIMKSFPADNSDELIRFRDGIVSMFADKKALQLLRQNTAFERPEGLSLGAAVFREVMRNGLLSGLADFRNIIGNSFKTALQPLDTLSAAAVDAAKSAVTGSPRQVFAKEVGPATGAMLSGFWRGIREDFVTIMREGPAADELARLDLSPEIISLLKEGEYGAKGKAVGKVAGVLALGNVPQRFAIATDAIFKRGFQDYMLHSRAIREAAKIADVRGLSKTDEAKLVSDFLQAPRGEWVLEARDFARYETFNADPGTYGRWLINARNDAPFIGDILVPFINTRLNIFKEGAARSPLAFIPSEIGGKRIPIVPAKGSIWEKGISSEEQSRRIARALTGTLATTVAAYEVTQGNITGSGPSKDDPRYDSWNKTHQPYSIRVGDNWVDYSQVLGPVGIPIQWASDIVEGSMYAKNKNLTDTVWTAIDRFAGSVFNQHDYYESIKDLADFFDSVRRGDNPADALAKMGAQWLQQATPASGALRTYENFVDSMSHKPSPGTHGLKLFEQTYRAPFPYNQGVRTQGPKQRSGFRSLIPIQTKEIVRPPSGNSGE